MIVVVICFVIVGFVLSWVRFGCLFFLISGGGAVIYFNFYGRKVVLGFRLGSGRFRRLDFLSVFVSF